MSKIGTVERPVESTEPMKIARAVWTGLWREPAVEGPGLVHCKGEFWEWYGGVWARREITEVEDKVYLEVENYMVEVHTMAGVRVTKYKPDRAKVSEIVRALQALTRMPIQDMPCWLATPVMKCDPLKCIAFQDVMVDAETGKTWPRDWRWLGPVLPVNYVPEAECPRWMTALEEWGNGDPGWAPLAQRWFGYCLLGYREYAKWMLLQGPARTGKGILTGVLQNLVGEGHFMNTGVREFGGDFGSDGWQFAQVLNVPEFSEQDKYNSEAVASTLKQILGRDRMTINAKNVRQLRNQKINAAPMMAANEIPKLPNKGEGLTTKLLILPFTATYRDDPNQPGKDPQYELKDVLAGEAEGIAAWAVKGAMDVLAAAPKEKWPWTVKGREKLELFKLMNHPLDGFLQARCIKDPDGWVPSSLIRTEWVSWIQATGMQDLKIPLNQLSMKLEYETSWGLHRVRKDGEDGRRIKGLKGLLLRKDIQDEM